VRDLASEVEQDLRELVKLGSRSAALALQNFDKAQVQEDYGRSGMSVSDVTDLLISLA
jgi:hypothetical protein